MKTFVQQQKLSSGGAGEASQTPVDGKDGKRRSLLPDTLSPQAQAALESSFGSKVRMCVCVCACVCTRALVLQ